MTESTCRRCGRRLTSASSRQAGYGAWCARLQAADHAAAARIARLAEQTHASHEQVVKALELLDDDGLVRVGVRIWLAVSSRGVDEQGQVLAYSCSTRGCACESGSRGRRCYHQVAVAIAEGLTVTTAAWPVRRAA